jgi:hypothetical protein
MVLQMLCQLQKISQVALASCAQSADADSHSLQ